MIEKIEDLLEKIPSEAKIFFSWFLILLLPLWILFKGVEKRETYQHLLEETENLSEYTRLKKELGLDKKKESIATQLEKETLSVLGKEAIELHQRELIKGRLFDEVFLYLKKPVWVDKEGLSLLLKKLFPGNKGWNSSFLLTGLEIKKNTQTKKYQVSFSLLERKPHK